MSAQSTILLRVSNHSFRVNCSANETAILQNAAQAVNSELAAMAKQGGVPDGEKAALMVAIKIAARTSLGQAGSTSLAKIDTALDHAMAIASQASQSESTKN